MRYGRDTNTARRGCKRPDPLDRVYPREGLGIIRSSFSGGRCRRADALIVPAAALGNHSATDLVSTSATAGNGANGAVFRASSDDGTRVFFQTNEQLLPGDTDAAIDLYERANGLTTLLSTGPTGGNGANSATFAGASRDGTRIIFRTTEKLVSGDTDSVQDLYERAGGVTTQVSTGPTDGNGTSPGVFSGISRDGTHVFFQTAEPLVAGDTDTYIDVYDRSGGTTTRVSTGALGGNGPFAAMFDGATPDGSHVYFHTDEALESSDFDERMDVYQRTGGATTHLSIGPAGGNGNDRLRLRRVLRRGLRGRLEGVAGHRRGARVRGHGHGVRRLRALGRQHLPSFDRAGWRQRRLRRLLRRGLRRRLASFLRHPGVDGGWRQRCLIRHLPALRRDHDADVHRAQRRQRHLLQLLLRDHGRRLTAVLLDPRAAGRGGHRHRRRTCTSARAGARRSFRPGPTAATASRTPPASWAPRATERGSSSPPTSR